MVAVKIILVILGIETLLYGIALIVLTTAITKAHEVENMDKCETCRHYRYCMERSRGIACTDYERKKA